MKLLETPAVTPGQDFVKKIGIPGAIFFLLLSVLTLIMCFTYRFPPLSDYTVSGTAEDYEDPKALYEEVNGNLLPHLEGNASCALSDDGKTVCVTIDSEHFEANKKIITYYFDEELFTFIKE